MISNEKYWNWIKILSIIIMNEISELNKTIPGGNN